MTHHFLIGMIVSAVAVVLVVCFLVSFVLSALGGIAEHSFRSERERNEEMRRWLETNAERRDWTVGESHERHR